MYICDVIFCYWFLFTDSSDEDKENKAEPKKEWWESYLDNEEIMDDINESGKLVILFEILKECELIGDKLLVLIIYIILI